MASFGETSTSRLELAHPDLVVICYDVIPYYDFSVLETYRSDERQDELFNTILPNGQRLSTKRAGESKHNSTPSRAIDLAPFPIDWDNPKRFYLLAGMLFQAAAARHIDIRWGGDWDRDWDHTDQTLFDLPHFELA